MIERIIQKAIQRQLDSNNKVIIIYGARQVGKTTLVNTVLNKRAYKTVNINADELRYHEVFTNRDIRKMEELVGNNDLLVIDEAQNIQDIGINIKILHDAHPSLRIILTGSSSFELANQTSEPLTGRKRTFTLFPISIGELTKKLTVFDIKQKLDEYLRFGLYPDILNTNNVEEKKIRLKELSSSYLYKDVLQLSNIRNSQKIFKLLQLLALQIGSTVSVNKLGNSLNMSNDTVERYIDLLEKSYVIFRRTGFSRNLSKEISKMDKIYFYDLGIRNAILDNFNSIELRSDAGALWKNFIITERLKHNFYSENEKRSYFWRTYTGAEIDMIEESEGKLSAFEIKFNNKTVKAPKTWQETYDSGEFHTINKDNFLQFIS